MFIWSVLIGLSRNNSQYIDTIDQVDEFNRKLMKYLIWHKTEKSHRGMGNLLPLRYHLDNYINTPKKSNMLWTLTIS